MRVYEGKIGEMKGNGRIPHLDLVFMDFLIGTLKEKRHDLVITGRQISCPAAGAMAENISSGHNAYPDPEKIRKKLHLHLIACQNKECPAKKYFP